MNEVKKKKKDFESKTYDSIMPSHLLEDFAWKPINLIDVPFCS